MGFPRRWSGYLSGAVKSTKILSRLSSKNALTSNSISRNNPTSSAGDFEWLTQHVISPSESKVSIFYCERPKSMWYSGRSRGGARMALVPLLSDRGFIFYTPKNPNFRICLPKKIPQCFCISKFYYLSSGKLKHANFNFGFGQKQNYKLRLCYCWFELMKNTIPKKIPCCFRDPKKSRHLS